MGHYTRMKFAAALSANTPAKVVDLLSAVAAGDWSRAEAIAPKHEFFLAEYWEGLLRGTFAAPSWPEADGRLVVERNADGSWNLAFHSSTKNYSNEIDKFLDWIGPHVASASGDVIGEFEGEDCERPTLLIAQAGRIDELYVSDESESCSAMGYF